MDLWFDVAGWLVAASATWSGGIWLLWTTGPEEHERRRACHQGSHTGCKLTAYHILEASWQSDWSR